MKKRARKSQEQQMGEQQLQEQEREQVAFCWRAGWNPVAMTLPLDPSAFWPLATCEMPRMLGTATARSVLPLPRTPTSPTPHSSRCPCPTLSTSCRRRVLFLVCQHRSRRFVLALSLAHHDCSENLRLNPGPGTPSLAKSAAGPVSRTNPKIKRVKEKDRRPVMTRKWP